MTPSETPAQPRKRKPKKRKKPSTPRAKKPAKAAAPVAPIVVDPNAQKHARFVELYIITLNATKAYREVFGCTARSAETSGPRLLRDVQVAAAVTEALKERSLRTHITADRVLEHWWNVCTADPNDLVEHRRGCCRYCWGKGNDYQRTRAEYFKALDELHELDKKSAKFDEQGGVGYNANHLPNANCPECFGDGVSRVIVKDTRNLNPAARALFAGLKQSRDGSIEIRTHDQGETWIQLARHLKMFAPDGDDTPGADDEARIRKMRQQLAAMDSATT